MKIRVRYCDCGGTRYVCPTCEAVIDGQPLTVTHIWDQLGATFLRVINGRHCFIVRQSQCDIEDEEVTDAAF